MSLPDFSDIITTAAIFQHGVLASAYVHYTPTYVCWSRSATPYKE